MIPKDIQDWYDGQPKNAKKAEGMPGPYQDELEQRLHDVLTGLSKKFWNTGVEYVRVNSIEVLELRDRDSKEIVAVVGERKYRLPGQPKFKNDKEAWWFLHKIAEALD